MEANSKINALLSLMDDSDMEVYSIVTEEICSYGKDIIPYLENLWENTAADAIQERIEMLIHQIQFSDLETAFKDWNSRSGSLLDGAILTARFQFPDLDEEKLKKNILKLWRIIWLELNDHLTPLEQLHVLNSILYHFYKLEGAPYNYENCNVFLINQVFDQHKGNALSNGILFQVVAEQIGLPVKAVFVPNHYLLAFFDRKGSERPVDYEKKENILFFIDATTGSVFSKADMLKYLKENNYLGSTRLFDVLDEKAIISHLLKELATCFDKISSDYKKKELLYLSRIILHK